MSKFITHRDNVKIHTLKHMALVALQGFDGLEGPVGPQGYDGCNGTKVRGDN